MNSIKSRDFDARLGPRRLAEGFKVVRFPTLYWASDLDNDGSRRKVLPYSLSVRANNDHPPQHDTLPTPQAPLFHPVHVCMFRPPLGWPARLPSVSPDYLCHPWRSRAPYSHRVLAPARSSRRWAPGSLASPKGRRNKGTSMFSGSLLYTTEPMVFFAHNAGHLRWRGNETNIPRTFSVYLSPRSAKHSLRVYTDIAHGPPQTSLGSPVHALVHLALLQLALIQYWSSSAESSPQKHF